MKACGNESFRRGDNFDALWKYEHALLLCHSYPSLKADTAALHSNIAAVCLKLGDVGSEDLLDPQQYPPSHVLWYAFTQQHASEAITLCPEAKILHKVKSPNGLHNIMTLYEKGKPNPLHSAIMAYGKFGGELNLVIWWPAFATTKLKYAKISCSHIYVW